MKVNVRVRFKIFKNDSWFSPTRITVKLIWNVSHYGCGQRRKILSLNLLNNIKRYFLYLFILLNNVRLAYYILLFAVCFAISSVYEILGVNYIFLEIKDEKMNFTIVKSTGKYFVYLANTCTNSIVKTKCYSEVNILSTSLTN